MLALTFTSFARLICTGLPTHTAVWAWVKPLELYNKRETANTIYYFCMYIQKYACMRVCVCVCLFAGKFTEN